MTDRRDRPQDAWFAQLSATIADLSDDAEADDNARLPQPGRSVAERQMQAEPEAAAAAGASTGPETSQRRRRAGLPSWPLLLSGAGLFLAILSIAPADDRAEFRHLEPLTAPRVQGWRNRAVVAAEWPAGVPKRGFRGVAPAIDGPPPRAAEAAPTNAAPPPRPPSASALPSPAVVIEARSMTTTAAMPGPKVSPPPMPEVETAPLAPFAPVVPATLRTTARLVAVAPPNTPLPPEPSWGLKAAFGQVPQIAVPPPAALLPPEPAWGLKAAFGQLPQITAPPPPAVLLPPEPAWGLKAAFGQLPHFATVPPPTAGSVATHRAATTNQRPAPQPAARAERPARRQSPPAGNNRKAAPAAAAASEGGTSEASPWRVKVFGAPRS